MYLCQDVEKGTHHNELAESTVECDTLSPILQQQTLLSSLHRSFLAFLSGIEQFRDVQNQFFVEKYDLIQVSIYFKLNVVIAADTVIFYTAKLFYLQRDNTTLSMIRNQIIRIQRVNKLFVS